MFVLIIEQRISSKIKKMGDPVADWYALMACALPFAPTKSLELRSKPGALFSTIELQEVIYNPDDGTFWGESLPILHPRPNAKTVAEKLVAEDSWDVAVKETSLEEAKVAFTKDAIRKLQQALKQMQSKIGLPSIMDQQAFKIMQKRLGKRRH